MIGMPPPADAQAYFNSLTRAGQDAMKQFNSRLASASGVSTKQFPPPARALFLVTFIVDLQREYIGTIIRRESHWQSRVLRNDRH